MHSQNIENTVVDEANQRTYIVLAPRVLSDGEIYRAIRREILKRGGALPNAGGTLTINLTPGEPAGTPPPDLPHREDPAPQIVADRGTAPPQPMIGLAQANSPSGKST